jgi:hypothetical protein
LTGIKAACARLAEASSIDREAPLRTLVITVLLALGGTPAFAQQEQAPRPRDEASITYEHCRFVLAARAEGKGGAVDGRSGQPLSKADLDEMYARCAEKLAKDERDDVSAPGPDLTPAPHRKT